YKGEGFFAKGHSKLSQVVRAGVKVKRGSISSFLKVNQQELESIEGFFTTHLPIKERGVELVVSSPSSVRIRPTFIAEGDHAVRFFGDFVYIEKEGFCELPAQFRLPDVLQEEREIGGPALASFLSDELVAYEKYFTKIDPRCKRTHRFDIEANYLVRNAKGGIKAQLDFVSELGKCNVLEIYEAFENKYRYLFSESGLIDLGDERVAWMRGLKPTAPDQNTVELSTMDFLRLEATIGVLEPRELSPQADITRRLLKELREFSVLEKPQLRGLKSELRLYQNTGLNWLWFLYKNGLSGLLCDDMGLGKTHQAMALMAAISNQHDFRGRFLVVCPTSVIYHWEDKLELFLPGMKVHTFHGLKRSLKGLPKEGLILTSYGTFRMEKEVLKKIRFELATFDEIQVAKNPSSQIHSALSLLDTKMSLGLTGTPIENNLRELKALFDIVLPGYMPKEGKFREQFMLPIERDLNEERKAQLSQIIRPFILRRRKSEVLDELPEKSEDKSYCDLSPVQVALYKEALGKNSEEYVAELRDRDVQVRYMHIFSLLSELKQICNHPALLLKDPTEYKQYSCGKWDLFVELLEEAYLSQQKVVVFSQYLGMLDIMEMHLKEKGWKYAQIRGGTTNRREELKRFQEDSSCFIFLGSLQAAGLGIDLTAASIVILYDRWWNAARENQAVDRVHRIGQKWGVQVYKLITKGTIEEKIDKMITKKGRLMEEVVTTDDQGVLKKFSRSDLIDLLSFSLLSE
ncbi:MAG: DEAD/DEAH box helicase, partial [Chlamydiales bacterium]